MRTGIKNSSSFDSSSKKRPAHTHTMKQPLINSQASTGHQIIRQRKSACACGGACPKCRLLAASKKVNPPDTAHSKKGLMQRHAITQAKPDVTPPIVRDVLRSPGRPLDAATRAHMEPRFGHDFSRVRVHTDALAASSARAVDALAYTVGQDVVFAAGQFAPGARAGRKLLAHELTHVLQQSEPAGERAIQRQAKNPFKGRSTSETVDYRAEKDVDAVLAASKILWPFIGDRFDQGVRLKGAVTYLPQKEFEQEYIIHAKRSGDSIKNAKNVGGFYDRKKDRVVVPRSATLETLVHEAIHKFSDSSFQQIFASGLNEGVTQYFTNLLLDEYGLSAGKAYPDKLVAGAALAKAVGLETLALGYFLGPARPVFLELAERVPNFDQGQFLSAIRGDNIDWKSVASMMQLPPETKITEQQQIFRSAMNPSRTIAIEPSLAISQPGDAYEREADAMAEQVLQMAEPGRAGANALTNSPTTLLQRQQASGQPATDDDKKAELAFYAGLNFFPAGEPKEGQQFGMWLWVWNPGWLPTGPHENEFTLYEADDCYGCRRENDKIMSMSISAPSLDSLVQEGPYRYKRLIILPALDAGNYCAYAELDVDDTVEELSEFNNTYETCFTVHPRDDVDEAE